LTCPSLMMWLHERASQSSLVPRAEDFYVVEHSDCLHTLAGAAGANPHVEAKLRDAADNLRNKARAHLGYEDDALAALDDQVRYSDERVAERNVRVWHGATENGP
jgi:hypothetical protein